MLTINDFKEKQVVFIQSQDWQGGEGLKFRNQNIVLYRDGKKFNQISCHKVLAVFVLGNVTVTTNFIRESLSFGISVFFLGKNFYPYARIEANAEGNYLLRMKQYKNKKELEMAKLLMKNKIRNQLALLRNEKKLNNYVNQKNKVFSKIDEVENEKSLLGVEGTFSREFFGAYFDEANWYKRMPRTKVDVNNLLLDMGYTFLFNYMDCLLRLYGFDVYKGFYHKLFFNRKSLTCDVVEPFRCIIDRALLKAHRLGRIDEKDFRLKNGAYVLPWGNSRKYSSIFLEEIVHYKEDIFNYVLDLYRFVMKDGKDFPSFLIR